MRNLSPRVKEHFDKFVTFANKTSLHPNDWNLFYPFVRASHAYQRKLSPIDLRAHLESAGFSDSQIELLAVFYRRGRDMLADGNVGQRRRYQVASRTEQE